MKSLAISMGRHDIARDPARRGAAAAARGESVTVAGSGRNHVIISFLSGEIKRNSQ